MTSEAMSRLKDFLNDRAAEVRAIETEAEARLHGAGGQQAYETLMRQKAELLRDLLDDALELEGVRAEALPAAVVSRVERFSASAAMSLQVGSVFFMSALLYPEDHVPGSPNDLELFADSL